MPPYITPQECLLVKSLLVIPKLPWGRGTGLDLGSSWLNKFYRTRNMSVRATVSTLGLPTLQPTHIHTSSWRKRLLQCFERNSLSPKQPHPPKFKEILMMEEMFIYQRRLGAQRNTKHYGFFGENQWHFFNQGSLATSYAMVLKKKKKERAFCSAKFPTILISLSFEPFNWQCQMQFVFCSKANALK